jgi:hypothetical protein
VEIAGSIGASQFLKMAVIRKNRNNARVVSRQVISKFFTSAPTITRQVKQGYQVVHANGSSHGAGAPCSICQRLANN